jgi:two-component sensor histidine kinase
VDGNTLRIGRNFADSIDLCVNELATKAANHAFQDGKGVVLISLKQEDDAVCLSVSDNSMGPAGSAERPERV